MPSIWSSASRSKIIKYASSEELKVINGQVRLLKDNFFDFETGSVKTEGEYLKADVKWSPSNIYPVFGGWNGTVFYPMGTVHFDSISFSRLQGLPYNTNWIDTQFGQLTDGSVIAVRTRHANFAKAQVLKYNKSPVPGRDDIVIRWVTYIRPTKFLDVKVTMGSAPDWLVTQYVVQCTYSTIEEIRYCGTGSFGHDGGTVHGQISDESGAFPSSIVVNVTIDFEPDTNIQALQKIFPATVTETGVNVIFEPYHQVIQNTKVYLDLLPSPKASDYLQLKWLHHDASKNVVASGQKYIPGHELRKQPVTQYEIVFVPDPISAKDIELKIDGRFQSKVLPIFSHTYDLSDKAVIIRAKKLSNEKYKLYS